MVKTRKSVKEEGNVRAPVGARPTYAAAVAAAGKGKGKSQGKDSAKAAARATETTSFEGPAEEVTVDPGLTYAAVASGKRNGQIAKVQVPAKKAKAAAPLDEPAEKAASQSEAPVVSPKRNSNVVKGNLPAKQTPTAASKERVGPTYGEAQSKALKAKDVEEVEVSDDEDEDFDYSSAIVEKKKKKKNAVSLQGRKTQRVRVDQGNADEQTGKPAVDAGVKRKSSKDKSVVRREERKVREEDLIRFAAELRRKRKPDVHDLYRAVRLPNTNYDRDEEEEEDEVDRRPHAGSSEEEISLGGEDTDDEIVVTKPSSVRSQSSSSASLSRDKTTSSSARVPSSATSSIVEIVDSEEEEEADSGAESSTAQRLSSSKLTDDVVVEATPKKKQRTSNAPFISPAKSSSVPGEPTVGRVFIYLGLAIYGGMTGGSTFYDIDQHRLIEVAADGVPEPGDFVCGPILNNVLRGYKKVRPVPYALPPLKRPTGNSNQNRLCVSVLVINMGKYREIPSKTDVNKKFVVKDLVVKVLCDNGCIEVYPLTIWSETLFDSFEENATLNLFNCSLRQYLAKWSFNIGDSGFVLPCVNDELRKIEKVDFVMPSGVEVIDDE